MIKIKFGVKKGVIFHRGDYADIYKRIILKK